MLFRLWVTILFCHAEINHVDNICSFRIRSSDQEVVRLDVAVDEVLLVDGLYAGQLCVLLARCRVYLRH